MDRPASAAVAVVVLVGGVLAALTASEVKWSSHVCDCCTRGCLAVSEAANSCLHRFSLSTDTRYEPRKACATASEW